MGARDLLADLAGAGLSVIADGQQLVIRPASLLTDGLRTRLREAKPELLALLGADPRFAARRDRLLRWGWPIVDAEAVAGRLALRDRNADDRRLCLECRHLHGSTSAWRCGRHVEAAVGRDLPRALATQLQRCPAFTEDAS